MPYTPPLHTQVDLNLDQPRSASADLVLGGSVVPVDVFTATVSGSFGLRASMSAGYDNAVFRGLQTPVEAGFDSAAVEAQHCATAAWEPSTAMPVDNTALFDEAPAQIYVVGVGWRAATPMPADAAIAHQQATPVHQHAGSAWGLGAPTHTSTQAQHQQATPLHDTRAAAYGHGAPTHRQKASVWDGAARPAGISVQAPSHRAAAAHRDIRRAPWQGGKLIISTGGPWTPYQPPPPPPKPAIADLRLCQALGYVHPFGVNLVLGVDPCAGLRPDAPFYILPSRFYMSVHSLEAHLLPSLESIPIYDVSMASDVDSTVWTFSAKGPVSLFDALAPATPGAPKQVRITLDGIAFVFLVDKITRAESFGQREAAISGRSATALVGQPYARQTSRVSTNPRTAQQLAAEALDLSGVGLDWGIADWLVPAGAWSHTGTPLAAVQQIAQAAGGYINSHRSAPTVLVRHPYPTLPGGIPGGPWNWEGASGAFAADVELAPDALITTAIERLDGPDVDGIYVSGTTQGIQAHVYRQGTLGAKLAPMEVDALITANPAAQQRGYSVLGQSGAKHLVQISMPVLVGGTNPGVLDVGQLVQVNHSQPWRGRVRSVSVQARFGDEVRQSVNLERHLS